MVGHSHAGQGRGGHPAPVNNQPIPMVDNHRQQSAALPCRVGVGHAHRLNPQDRPQRQAHSVAPCRDPPSAPTLPPTRPPGSKPPSSEVHATPQCPPSPRIPASLQTLKIFSPHCDCATATDPKFTKKGTSRTPRPVYSRNLSTTCRNILAVTMPPAYPLSPVLDFPLRHAFNLCPRAMSSSRTVNRGSHVC
ncbi:hypothetical protein BC834DRAFT_907947 [Gloeopeniophorella convolvens]|nr:hypothetical protein BC834DRAFT_907947 [Gloeopeniophorella convolvens]